MGIYYNNHLWYFECLDKICVQKEETSAFRDLGSGNRIATWLTYVSINEYPVVTVSMCKIYKF